MALNNSTTTTIYTIINYGQLEPVGLEAYSAVLSAAALALASVLGGGGSFSLLLAIFHSRQVRKYSYTLLIAFCFLCCGLDLVWCPVELAHLMIYHHTMNNPTRHFPAATFAVYILLSAGIAILITAFCVENVIRLVGAFSPGLRRFWPVSVSIVLFLTSVMATLGFLWASLVDQQEGTINYLILHPMSSTARVYILSVLLLLVVVGACVAVVTMAITMRRGMIPSESFLSAHSHTEANNSLPHFLLNQSHVNSSKDDVGVESAAPSLSKLSNDVAIRSHSPAGRELSTPGSRGTSMLGVNMAQVLGRRRHTICQIGDSGAPPSPIGKPKQYNYVRKFSVDISALQAQLENPKTFKDKVPFQSDQDLTQRQQQQNKPTLPESRGPLLPLAKAGQKSEGGDVKNVKTPLPVRPPVITVSEDVKEDPEDVIEEVEEKKVVETVKAADSSPKLPYMPIVNKEELTGIPRLPVTQPVDEEDEEEEEEEEEQKQNSVANPPEDVDIGSKRCSFENRVKNSDKDFVKMTLLMAMTFSLSTFPLLVMEALKDAVLLSTYVNISTCLRALSMIQTIIYPHIILCMDGVVRKALKRLRNRVGRVCCLRDSDCLDIQPDHTSSTTSQM